MKKIALFFYALLLLPVSSLMAQEAKVTEVLTSGNKITSVYVVLAIILAGILAYLLFQDKKIKKLEDRMKN